MSDRFEKHAVTVTLLTFVSRVTGLVRDAALARIFGVGAVMDAFWFAFMIPNLFRRLFGEGALSASFLPVYAKLMQTDAKQAHALGTLVIGLMALVLGGVTLVGEVGLGAALLAGPSSEALTPALSHGERGGVEGMLAIKLTMIMLPYMPLVCMVAILGSMLQVRGRFGPMAAAPIVLNLCFIAAAVGLNPYFKSRAAELGEGRDAAHVTMVACSVLLAGVLQILWSVWSLRGSGWWIGMGEAMRTARDSCRQVLRQALPMFIGLGVLQLNTFMDDLIASYPTTVGPTIFGVPYPLETGALTAISNAQRLYEFPLGVFGIAIATAIFPALAKLANDEGAFAATLRRGLRLVVFIGLPASVGLMLVRHELTAVIFQGGDFDAADTERVSFVLMGFAPAIWAYSMNHVLTRAFYAKGDAMTPVKVGVGMVGLNFALNCALIWTPLKEAGLAWSTAFCAVVQVVILLWLARRFAGTLTPPLSPGEREEVAAPLVDRSVVAGWIKCAIAAGVMAAAVFAVDWMLGDSGTSWSEMAMRLAALVVVGAAVFSGVSLVMRMPELKWAIGRGK